MKVDSTFVSGNIAVVEMTSISTTLNGKPFPDTYCWVVRFVDRLGAEERKKMIIGENGKVFKHTNCNGCFCLKSKGGEYRCTECVLANEMS